MELVLHKEQDGISVTLSGELHGTDGVFWLYGGTRPHIGAVCVCTREDGRLLTTFAGHREDEIASTLAGQLAGTGSLSHIVVCAGIHYDRIPREWIAVITELCRELGEEMALRLAGAQKEVL